ncbi:ankyrin repeat domain-containing protein [Flavobacterium sp. XGLA_31]|uniref:ankyrin repeat domain-containing protein n=1 Tax=Flavobacterium sp. XGLA_31 TaxID=3447666 RepID=UPI003F2F6007
MKKTVLTTLLFLLLHTAFGQETVDVFDIARKGTTAQAKEVVKTNPNAFKTVNKEGFSPLTLACYRGNNDVAKYLIETGCDINQNSSMGTPLMAAIVKGNNEITRYLLEKNANVNLTDANGTTALMYAVMFKNKEVVMLLLQKKANKSPLDSKGKTAFEYAVFSGNEEIINLLK